MSLRHIEALVVSLFGQSLLDNFVLLVTLEKAPQFAGRPPQHDPIQRRMRIHADEPRTAQFLQLGVELVDDSDKVAEVVLIVGRCDRVRIASQEVVQLCYPNSNVL